MISRANGINVLVAALAERLLVLLLDEVAILLQVQVYLLADPETTINKCTTLSKLAQRTRCV